MPTDAPSVPAAAAKPSEVRVDITELRRENLCFTLTLTNSDESVEVSRYWADSIPLRIQLIDARKRRVYQWEMDKGFHDPPRTDHPLTLPRGESITIRSCPGFEHHLRASAGSDEPLSEVQAEEELSWLVDALLPGPWGTGDRDPARPRAHLFGYGTLKVRP